MHRLALPLALTVLLGMPRIGAQTPSRADIDKALAAVYPSVVRIAVVTVSFGAGREVRSEAFGSGTIVSPDGYVVTNHHVAGRAQRVVCTLSTEEEIPADVVGTDPLADITVVKLRPPAPRRFPAAVFGSSHDVMRGDPVLALGSPLALSQSVTLGIVSNVDMVLPRSSPSGVSLDGEDVGSIVRWIGHDAAIYPGNSGGPLVDLQGRIIGVNELSYGLSAAIPADIVKVVSTSLIEHGHVTRGSIGAEFQPRLSTERHSGALVAWVENGSPAAAAGLESGDLVTAIAGTPVDIAFGEQVPIVNQIIAALAPGKAIPIAFIRSGVQRTVTVAVHDRTAALARPLELREWGAVAADLTPAAALDLGRSTTNGVRILSVRAGGASQRAKPAIEPDDVIVDVNGTAMTSAADLQKMTGAALASTGHASVLVTIERREERRLSVVDLSVPHADQPPLEARKAWLAIEWQVLTPVLADRLGVHGRTGVRVTRVIDPNIPLHVGDLILAIDGAPVRASAIGDELIFSDMLRQYAPGASVPLTVSRDGAERAISAVVQTAPPHPSEMRRYEDADFGFRAREMSDRDLDDPRLAGTPRGLVVDAVEPGSWAALARLDTGDVIIDIAGERITGVDALAARLKTIKAERARSVVLHVRRGIRTLFVEIEPAWERQSNEPRGQEDL